MAMAMMGLAAGPLSGCQEEGSAEKAGKALDEAVEDAKEELEEAKDKLTE